MEEKKFPMGGCLPEEKDIRDYKLKAGVVSEAALPEEFVLVSMCRLRIRAR